MRKSQIQVSRRDFLKIAATALGGATLACGRRANLVEDVPTAPVSPPDQPPTATLTETATLEAVPTEAPTGPQSRMITANDFKPEQTNYVDTLVVVVNFEDRLERPFDLLPYWDRVFGTDDPIRQLNAYYAANFYNQLQLRPVEVGDKGYLDLELPGAPSDYAFGYLIGYESDEIDKIDPEAAQRLVLEVVSRTAQALPEQNLQDVFVFIVLNASGSEYGRGAAGALPTGGIDPVYDLFVGNLEEEDASRFENEAYFRVVEGNKIVGVVRHSGYTYDDYFTDRGEAALADQFILGVGLFSNDAPLSCASHDILHGLRRKSAYATPPEGRIRAINCLYNLPLQSEQIVGSHDHGRFDRSVNCSPYLGWWDPVGDHLHPIMPREFFSGHPHGTSAFTKMRMEMIPERCVTTVEADYADLRLSSLSNPFLPAAGDPAEAMVVKVPLLPEAPNAAHVYLLLEYRCRPEGEHPDNFTISPTDVFGDPAYDPGYNPENPEASEYINPPMQFVSKEGVLVYLVNEKMTEIPVLPYNPEEWFAFHLVLLNPAGHDQREDLTQAALGAGERMIVDFNTIYSHTSVPVVIEIAVSGISPAEAQVQISRTHQG